MDVADQRRRAEAVGSAAAEASDDMNRRVRKLETSFDELAAHTPDRLWLTEISARDGRLFLEGNSLDNDVIADFLKSLGSSEYLGNVDLIRTDGDTAVEGVRLVEFEISTDLVIPDPEMNAGSAANPAGA